MIDGDTPLPSRCLVFADVAGSTRLYERLGDKAALRVVDLCLKLAAAASTAYQGEVVKTIGDEIMVAFPSAEQGLLAACDMQQRIAAVRPIAGQPLAIRVGCQWGPVVAEDGDYFGDTVNIAARLTELAKAGQVLTSQHTMNAMPELLRPPCRRLEELVVKGKQTPLAVVEVLWQGSEVNLTLMADQAPPATTLPQGLLLRHGEREWRLGCKPASLVLGRDTACDVVIDDSRASRNHARIEWRPPNFVLTDCSTNGTYVYAGGESGCFLLRREDTVLRGTGYLSFGQAWQAGVERLTFQILE